MIGMVILYLSAQMVLWLLSGHTVIVIMGFVLVMSEYTNGTVRLGFKKVLT